ncbi:MAG TPA: putative toxin-antitoxin system toxin component, PIN family [Vicinamibacterales bacterium]|nr:putative toxin-antitoxin system toxin component, PIN family [Vicinamibacterales bacterium]HOQ59567.1 putative toxin-antitoxin system toxin component, PIN family [Vicinamibacterales bacterium]HPK72342.1 putative toxin-antitoxin system toxin component, PIN family [Vicinamibacterales bacterium]
MTAVLRAVLDANVFVSAAIHPDGPPGRIIEQFLRADAFTLVLSEAIVDEIMRALTYPKVLKYVRRDLDPGLWMEDLAVLADFVLPPAQAHGVSDDPDDDKYLAAAIAGRASLVVSGDPHLLAVEAYEGVRIVTPRASLNLLTG